MEEEREMATLLGAQQDELDAVLMYRTLAKVVEKKYPEDAEVFKQLAADEGHHAAVFESLTGEVLKPKHKMAILLPVLYRVLGKKRLYPLIAKGEYDADESYAPVVERFPEVQSVKDDEKRHGDMVMAMLEELAAKPLLIAGVVCTLTGAVVITAALWRRYKKETKPIKEE